MTRETVRRWLEIIYRQKPQEFRALLPIKGRGGRAWIAKTMGEVLHSGQSTKPFQIIPGDDSSPWVMTNGSGPQQAAVAFWMAHRLGIADENPEQFVKMSWELLSDVYRANG